MNKNKMWKNSNLLRESSNKLSLDSSNVIIYVTVGEFLDFDVTELEGIDKRLYSPMSVTEKDHAERPYINSKYSDNKMFDFEDFSSILDFMRDTYGLASTLEDWKVDTNDKDKICFDNLCTVSFDDSGYPRYTPVKTKSIKQIKELLNNKDQKFLGLSKVYCTLQIDIQGTISPKDVLKLL